MNEAIEDNDNGTGVGRRASASSVENAPDALQDTAGIVNRTDRTDEAAIQDKMIAVLMSTCRVSEDVARETLQTCGWDAVKAMMCLEQMSRQHHQRSNVHHDSEIKMNEEVEMKPAPMRPTADSSTVSVVVPNPTPKLPPPPLRASRVPSRPPQTPGAVAVQGPNPPSLSRGGSDEYTITAQSNSASTSRGLPLSNPTSEAVTVEARLVQGSEKDLDVLQEELQQRDLELEQLRSEREHAPVAQVVSKDEEAQTPPTAIREEDYAPIEHSASHSHDQPTSIKRFLACCQKRRWVVVTTALLVITGIVLGVLLPNLQEDDLTPTQPLSSLLSSVSLDGGAALRTPSTAQNKAYEWLANNTNLDSYSDEKRIQRYTLATLYYSTNGDDWKNNTRWLGGSDECLWYNDAEDAFCFNGTVVELDLGNNNLNGTIPVELALLSTSVDEVHFGGNSLTGTIPTEVGLLTSLSELYLHGNALTRTIPSEIGLLTRLTEIFLLSNDLVGTIPTEVGLLTNLNALWFHLNDLEGPMPTEIGLMQELGTLYLENNEFVGPVPSEIGLLTKLSVLRLYSNAFSDKIPSEIGRMRSMNRLLMHYNDFKGKIPSEIGLLRDLVDLDLGSNELSSTIPSEIAAMTSLDYLSLFSNMLTGTIPSEISLLSNLDELFLYSNPFSGNFTCPYFINKCFISCIDEPIHDLNSTCRSL